MSNAANADDDGVPIVVTVVSGDDYNNDPHICQCPTPFGCAEILANGDCDCTSVLDRDIANGTNKWFPPCNDPNCMILSTTKEILRDIIVARNLLSPMLGVPRPDDGWPLRTDSYLKRHQ